MRAKRSKRPGALTPGMRCLVHRAYGEPVTGVISRGPVAHLLDIGEFYLVRRAVPDFAGKGTVGRDIGMYERGGIQLTGKGAKSV